MSIGKTKAAATAIAIAIAATVLIAQPAWAGHTCEERKPTVATIERGLALAQLTAQALDASGATVVVLARAGQNLDKYGVRYSHLGFAYRQADAKGNAVWRVVHKLNRCGTAEADLYRQGLGEFFLTDLWRYEAAWAVPSLDVQERLLPVLRDDARLARLHIRNYSVVSYVWGRKYQQSNQWAIETLASAMEPTAATRDRAQAWLQFKGYEPTVLKLGPLTRLGARGAANVAFDDHPNEKRFSDRIETVTVDSVYSWLQRSQLASGPVSLRVP